MISSSTFNITLFQTLFSKKFKGFAYSCPLSLSMDFVYAEDVFSVRVARKDFHKDKVYFHVFKGPGSNDLRNEEIAAKELVYEIKKYLVQFYPLIVYRKFSQRQKTPDEAMAMLLRGEDSDIFVNELQDLNTFVLEKADLRRSLFTLLDKEGSKTYFKYEPAAPFLIKARKNLDPEELGQVFFKRAKKVKKEKAQ